MRSPTHHARKTPATLVIFTASIVVSASLSAQTILAGVNRSIFASADELAPRVHQSTRLCGKKWLKQARQLSEDQLGWMLQEKHSIYTFGARGRTVMTLEILSAPSFRDCDVRRHWNKRETTVRVTYVLPDGTRKVQIENFTRDDIYFANRPRVFAGTGKALLSGVKVDGSGASRWIALPRLSEALGSRPEAEAGAGTLIAVLGVADPVPPAQD